MIEAGNQHPPPPPAPPGAPTAGNPWEQRSQIGFGAGLIESIKLFATRPSAAYEQTRRRGDLASPLLFAVIVGWFGTLIGQVWQFMFQSSFVGLFPPEMRDQLLQFMATTPLALAASLVLTPIFLMIGLFIWSLVHHVSLLLVGALGQSDSGFEGTFRINGYAYVVQLAAIVPFVGWLISICWYIALQTIGATRMHRTTTGRALAGALLPLVACCVCFAMLALVFGAMLATAFQ